MSRHCSSGRTPLFSEVRRLMHKAAGPTRRDVLRASVAGAATLALSAPARALPATPRVIIIGAGLAGLVAARRLKRAGISAAVYEAANRAGGRVLTSNGAMGPGLSTEIGGEFIDTGHKDMRDLAREFGLCLRDFAAGAEGDYETKFHFGGIARSEADVITEFEPIAARMKRDIRDFRFDSYHSYNERAFELDNTSIADYLSKVGASGWIRDLLDVAYNIEYGRESTDQSSLNLLYLIGTSTNHGFEPFGSSDERFSIAGGNQQLTDALFGQVESQVHLGHRLVAIEPRGSGFRLTIRKPNGAHTNVDCDVALLTLPFTLLRQVDIRVPLPSVKQQAIDELGYGTNSKLIMGMNSRFWRNSNLGGDWFTDNGVQSGWDSSRLQPGTKGSLTFYSGGAIGEAVGQGSPQSQVNHALPKVNELFPGASPNYNGRVIRFHWPSYPWTLGSYACYRVGQYTQFSGAEFEPVGNLFFAGEHCSSDFQGYMNGAAGTGRIAANRILKAI